MSKIVITQIVPALNASSLFFQWFAADSDFLYLLSRSLGDFQLF